VLFAEEQFGQHHLAYLALFEKEMMGNYLRRLKSQSMDSMQRRFLKLQKRSVRLCTTALNLGERWVLKINWAKNENIMLAYMHNFHRNIIV
jgi:hypothetical protein